jgi:outer membrane immunogenic protein
MKQLFLAAAIAALATGSVFAADIPAPVYKAPPPAPVYSWTGCYVGLGGGYGMYNINHDAVAEPPNALPAGTPIIGNVTTGGKGWFGTAQIGCDYQVASSWVIGAFADYDWASIKGDYTVNAAVSPGLRDRGGWAFGGRIGYVVMPQLLTFFSAGFTQAKFDQINYLSNVAPTIGAATGVSVAAQSYNGYFIGGGTEYAFGWFPGLFWKTEYRYADYRIRSASEICGVVTAFCGPVGPFGAVERMHPYVQTIRSELVWRFGGGPVNARY